MAQYPRFEEAIRSRIVNQALQEQNVPTMAMVLRFNPKTNTATILATQPGSAEPGQIYNDVACPIQIGVQGVAPELGRLCKIVFPTGTMDQPVITNLLPYNFESKDYNKQYRAENDTPRFMMEM